MLTLCPLTLQDTEGFHTLLGLVAREKLYITFADAPPLKDVKAYITQCLAQNAPFFVLKKDNEIVGWCDCIPQTRETTKHNYVLGMGLHPDFRGQGWGRKLLKATLEAAFAHGAVKITLHVFEKNRRAKALYESEGFKEEGLLRKDTLIEGRYFNSFIMAKFNVTSQQRAALNPTREKALASQLRANLQRRKAQIKGRSEENLSIDDQF